MVRQNKWLFLVWMAGSWETRWATRPNDQWQPWESLEMKTYGFSLLKTCLKFIDARSLTQLPHLANRQASNNPTSRSSLNKFPFITRTKPERLKQNRQVILVTEKLDEGFFRWSEGWWGWVCAPRILLQVLDMSLAPGPAELIISDSVLFLSSIFPAFPTPQNSSRPRAASSRNSAQVNH